MKSMNEKVHYWTGHGTLCSLDNSVVQKPNHTTERGSVTCQYCKEHIARNQRSTPR